MQEPSWLKKEREEASSLSKKKLGFQHQPVKIRKKNAEHFTLHELIEKNEKLAKEIFLSRKTRPALNENAALLNAHFREANFFFVKKDGEIEIELDKSAAMNFFVVEDDASLFLTIRAGDESLFSSELFIKKGGKARLATLKEKCKSCSQFQHASISESASLTSVCFWSGHGDRLNTAELNGRSASLHSVDMCLADDNEQASINSSAYTNSPAVRANVIMKGVVKDKAAVSFGGILKVGEKGKGTVGNLDQDILLLDSGATAEAEPVLEIENEDSACSHAASIHPVEKRKLFYLESRGLASRDALTTLVAGFMHSALAGIEDKKLRKLFIPFE